MKGFKRLVLTSVAACAVLSQSAFAEKDGGFLGFELGANKVRFEQKVFATMDGNIKANGVLPSIGVKGGYKWFLNEDRDIGFRLYGAVDAGYGELGDVKFGGGYKVLESNMGMGGSVFPSTKNGYYTTFIDYYVGADLLLNIGQRKDLVYGVYAGAGVGGVTWIANGKEYEVTNGDRTYIDFQASANVGLRMIWDDKHSIELGGRFYFPKSKLFEAHDGTAKIPQTTPVSYTDTKHQRPFSFLLSYVYNF